MKKAQLIAPDAYPQMMSRADAARASLVLRATVTEEKAAGIIANAADGLREALLRYIAELERAGADIALVSDKAHEIKGFADTAGLPATARIAESLCHYLERCQDMGAATDNAVIALHVGAIGRASRDTNLDAHMQDAVIKELATLTAHKLAEASIRR